MTLRKEAPRAKSRWLTLAAVVGVFTLIFSGIAFAALPTDPLPGSTFEGGDGNLVTNVTGHTDWDTAPLPVTVGIDKPSGTSDNSFGQGTKEDNAAVTIVTGSIPPNKNDLTRFYESSETVGANTFLYLAWERAVNIGNANLDFEINQKVTSGFTASKTGALTLNRTAGDLLVTYDFGGSGTPTIGILRWLTGAHTPDLSGSSTYATNVCLSANTFPCWGDQKVLDSSEAEGAVNTVAVADPISGVSNLGVGLFGEAAINLTTSGVFPAGSPCLSLGSTFVKSRSSSSFPAEIKDFIAPVGIHISNCGEIKIIKHTDPRGFNQDFTYTTNVPSGSATNAATFSKTPDSTGTTTGFTLNDNGNTTADSTGNTEDMTNVQPGSYTVTEGTEPANFLLTHLTCTATTGSSGTQDATTLAQANISVIANGVVTCTYVNQHQKATPSVATQIHLDDTATLSGGDSPTGDVTFQLYDNSTCSGTAVATFDNVALSGSSATTVGVTPTTGSTDVLTGKTYSWKVIYNGDGNNNTVTVGCTDTSHETATISYAP